ncbi:MAG: penicillin acylase family protein, partial [Candidatus Eremiobacteraeota bacterium]|nr:penicillin acylase family protein [Candidatus Eremiobacteraeota bacterium]
MPLRAVALGLSALAGSVVLLAASFAIFVGLGWRAEAHLDGTLSGIPVRAPVVVLRDERGIPHVRAASRHDLMVAQGYLEGSDRLFQMDLLRRHVYGRLAEWFGRAALDHDREARAFDVAGVIAREYASLSAPERETLDAFSEGVNAAIAREPLPVEYRILFVRPDRWRPQDSLAAGFATVLDLTDDWNDVIERNRIFRRLGAAGIAALYPITDPRYDAPTMRGSRAPVAALPALPPRRARAAANFPEGVAREWGSNDWAAGAARTATGRALLANDPHLTPRIPGVWYLVDLQAPGFHVAGAALAGTPDVILGHNEHVAWGVTNGTVTSESVYAAGATRRLRIERFYVRFGATTEKIYAEDKRGFLVDDPLDPKHRFSVAWDPVRTPSSALSAFEMLDGAHSIDEALKALRTYPGPPQNFVLAGTGGAVTYHLAGRIPNDPAWGLWVHPAAGRLYPPVSFDALPRVASSRAAVVFTANDRTYTGAYPYRLSPSFAPP